MATSNMDVEELLKSKKLIIVNTASGSTYEIKKQGGKRVINKVLASSSKETLGFVVSILSGQVGKRLDVLFVQPDGLKLKQISTSKILNISC